MQEQMVNSGKHRFTLEKPFFVLATQNPIEQEGTYPLPEAQLDRFMFLINVGYPSAAEELLIAKTTTGAAAPPLNKLIGGEEILKFQDIVRRVPVPEHVYEYAVRLVLNVRNPMLGSVTGLHRSATRGASVEFAEYRKYAPGDDPKFLDWRVFARTDKFFIREFEADTNLRCYLVVDTSASMKFTSTP